MSECRYRDYSNDNYPDNSNSPDNCPDNSNSPDNWPDNRPCNSRDNRKHWLRDDEYEGSARMNIRRGQQSDEDDSGDSPRMRITGRNDDEEGILAVLGSRSRNDRNDQTDGAVAGTLAASRRGGSCGSGVEPFSGCEGSAGLDCKPKFVGPCEKREYRKCVNPDCTCAYYPADCRNTFWPEFAKPRWLPCSDLYCNGGR